MIDFIKALEFADVLALSFLIIVGASLWRLHHDENNQINIFDLVMDNGKLGKLATAFWAAFGVITWIMIKLTQQGMMTEGYLIGYGTMFVAPIIAKMFTLPPAPGTTTTISSKIVEVDQPVPPQPEKPKW